MRPPCEDLSETLAETRDSKLWGTDPVMRRKIFDVNVHPELGGWFAYRALVVLRGAGALGKLGPLDGRPGRTCVTPGQDRERAMADLIDSFSARSSSQTFGALRSGTAETLMKLAIASSL